MSFKTVSYLLGNFSQMASYLYKPVQENPKRVHVPSKKLSHEFQALRGSSITTSINAIKVKKTRRYTDHFQEEQDVDSSIDS
jgi:hypothetical protein